MHDVREDLQRRANVLDEPSNATPAESAAPSVLLKPFAPLGLNGPAQN